VDNDKNPEVMTSSRTTLVGKKETPSRGINKKKKERGPPMHAKGFSGSSQELKKKISPKGEPTQRGSRSPELHGGLLSMGQPLKKGAAGATSGGVELGGIGNMGFVLTPWIQENRGWTKESLE